MSKLEAGICFVINDYDWQTDTHYRHLYRLIETAASQRKVCLLVERPLKRQLSSPLDHLLVVQHQQFWLLRVIEELIWLIKLRRNGFSRFYVHYSKFGGLLAPLVSRLSGGKTFYWHCEEVMKHRRPISFWPGSLWTRLRTEWITNLCMRLADRVVTGNQAMVDHYGQAFHLPPDKMRILPNSIDLSEFTFSAGQRSSARQKLGLKQEDQVILYVHRLVERKGAHHLSEIIRQVISTHGQEPVKFLIVGDGPYRPKLQREVDKHNWGERVTLAGAVPNTGIGLYYAAANIFMMPSEAEGFPRVLLEAMASGLPLVTTDVGGVRGMLSGPQLDFLTKPGDCLRLGDLVSRLLNLTPKNLT